MEEVALPMPNPHARSRANPRVVQEVPKGKHSTPMVLWSNAGEHRAGVFGLSVVELGFNLLPVFSHFVIET